MNTDTHARRIAEGFALPDAMTAIAAYGSGLINDTFLVTTAGPQRYILQRLNAQVFPHPEWILENLRTLLEHARDQDETALQLPDLIPARDGRDFVRDSEGGMWRLLEFIPGSRSMARLASPQQGQAVGAALGQFHTLLHSLPIERLHTTLPGFHVTPAYLKRFDEVLTTSQVAFSQALANALSFVEARRAQVVVLEDARTKGALFLRPMHGDPKIDNFLFNEPGDTVIAVVDLDTVQPGLIQIDIADCMRSCCNRAGDTPLDAHAVRFDLPMAQAILQGYLPAAREIFTRNESEFLYEAIRLIPFELGLRFLTDHFAGDLYFKIAKPGQNLQRALAQFRLAEDIERHEGTLRQLIESLTDA